MSFDTGEALLRAKRIEQPWLSPFSAAARRVYSLDDRIPLHIRLGAAGAAQGGPLPRFVAQDTLPEGEAYEAFIARTRQVPTRDNVHDLFNGLAWLAFPALKWRLNALQSAQIARDGVREQRGPVRDALTLFDENAALWSPPPVLADALRQRDWTALFVTHRATWNDTAPPVLFGHALLEKLMHPRAAITAHLWLAPPGEDPVAWWAETLDEGRAAARPWHPLPVLGVPGWWQENERPDFYDDPSVFRPPRPGIMPV
jgi:hypothetical protein